MNSRISRIGIVGVVLASLTVPVAAQSIIIGPNGARIEDPRERDFRDRDRGRYDDSRDRRPDRRFDDEVSEREAVRIARREGLREVEDVRRTRSTFRVDGLDRRGRDITVVIDRRSGEVLSVRARRV